MSQAALAFRSHPVWTNWTQNIIHQPPSDGSDYYFAPTRLAELKAILDMAIADGAVLRVTGQRHTVAPLVIGASTGQTGRKQYLVDLACYADLGPDGDQTMVADAANATVTVNAGVSEGQLDAYLTQNNLMLRAVTAGGFFSIGGITAVDVHGATVAEPIIAGTVSAFTILRADGSIVTIDQDSSPVDGWKPLQFARVNLGALGIVTSVRINVLRRPYATTLQSGHLSCSPDTPSDFAAALRPLLEGHDRVETFYNPHAMRPFNDAFLVAWWDVMADPADQVPNHAHDFGDVCSLAAEQVYGAPSVWGRAVTQDVAIMAQRDRMGASLVLAATIERVRRSVEIATAKHAGLWITEVPRNMYMSYFFELPAIDAAGLAKVWECLQVVDRRMQNGPPFYIVAPIEFRFVSGTDAAMAGTYTKNPRAKFVSIEMFAYVEAVPASQYPHALLRFFADVERAWVALGGFPHQGKMYGFYDPQGRPGNFGAAFNPNFLAELRKRRGQRLQAFRDYREAQDPDGVFYNAFLQALLDETPAIASDQPTEQRTVAYSRTVLSWLTMGWTQRPPS